MTPFHGGLSASRFFPSGSRHRSQRQSSALDNNNSNNTDTTSAIPLATARTTGSTESLPPIAASPSVVPKGESMQRAGRSISEGRFRLPISLFGGSSTGNKGAHRRQASRDSGHLSAAGSSHSRSTSSGRSKGQPAATKSRTGFVLDTNASLTATTLVSVEQQCTLHDPSACIDTGDKSDHPSPASPTQLDSGIDSAGRVAGGSPSPHFVHHTPRLADRRGSDSFLFDMPLRAGPSGYAWSGASQSTSARSVAMARDPRRHGSDRPYLGKSRAAIDAQRSASSTSLRQQQSAMAVAGRFASPAIPALLAQASNNDDNDNGNDTNVGGDTFLLPPASPDILGTSPPGVHAWRRRRSLTPGPISTHINPSVSSTAPLSAHYPMGARSAPGQPAMSEKSESRLELWEARRRLRALGGLDELLAQPDATVKCTLTPVVCRDAYRLDPLSLRVEEEDEDGDEDDDEEEEEDGHALEEDDEHDEIFSVDGEEAFPMRSLADPAKAWWNRSSHERRRQHAKYAGEQRCEQSASQGNFPIPAAAPMERAATLPRAATAGSLLCKDDELVARAAFKQ
ncbi:hypothetical protein SYNPS1DRAFT_22283 [Syncephalis pseudoplumigaleata]|uniref:Uncharacterized protein n=1 Tax=Syncephalis pseudoplumigaleata TaxID=1712513 RepID=A0A4P9Z070_9FUNG|nr:hypothetical protein SYNPS1DRAFT_22283 [Syncephalis pseudoplumigaleata]|eukprot:RKP25837.1 hypothetical protein SYNPS1DRAFT_22283 [Syncephalis pseudoplumigaleata]